MNNYHPLEINNIFAAKVFITSAYSDPEPLSSFLKIIQLDCIKKHAVVDSPDDADIILFVENSRYHEDYFFKRLKNNPIVKQYPSKVFMYNPHDKPWFILPGLYASMPKSLFDESLIAACPYLESINPYIEYDPIKEPKFLLSFIGNINSPPRKKIIKIKHARALIKSSPSVMFGNNSLEQSKEHYAGILADSKFILCPRGAGTASYRLFEALQAGRVPIIISDDWVCPKGPQWEDFAVFVPEDKINCIPQLLEEEEKKWPIKSKLARQAWENFFAPDVMFTYLIDSLLAIQVNNSSKNNDLRISHYLALYKWGFRVMVIQKAKSLLRK